MINKRFKLVQLLLLGSSLKLHTMKLHLEIKQSLMNVKNNMVTYVPADVTVGWPFALDYTSKKRVALYLPSALLALYYFT